MGFVWVILSQFWCTSKSVLKYAGISNILMAALIKNRVISCTMGYLDIDLNIINLFDN